MFQSDVKHKQTNKQKRIPCIRWLLLQAVKINYNTVSRFQSPVFPAPEQHFYPASLAFGEQALYVFLT